LNEGGEFKERRTSLLQGTEIDSKALLKHLTLPKVECKTCRVEILRTTAHRTGGRCIPCYKRYLDYLFFINADTEEKLRNSMIGYINRYASSIELWEFTKIGRVHPEILNQNIKCDNAVISFYLNKDHWWLAATKYIVGKYEGNSFEFKPEDPFYVINTEPLIDGRHGKTEVFEIITTGTNTVVQFLIETGYPITAPFSYVRYWESRKFALKKANKQSLMQ